MLRCGPVPMVLGRPLAPRRDLGQSPGVEGTQKPGWNLGTGERGPPTRVSSEGPLSNPGVDVPMWTGTDG
jgi:hypothetical protein